MSNKRAELSAFIGISIFSFTGYLDFTIVPTALPAIQLSLHLAFTTVQWVLTGYFLALSMFMTGVGRILSCYGRRLIFMVLILFALASVGAGLSLSGPELIFFRVVQGLSQAIILPYAANYINTTYGAQRKLRAMSIFSLISGTGLICGPILSSILVEFLSWRWIFFINIPIIIVGFSLCFFSLKNKPKEAESRLDFTGIVLMSLMIFSLVLGFVESGVFGWDSSFVLTSFSVFVITFLAFVLNEKLSLYPIVPLEIFKSGELIAIYFLVFMTGGASAVIFLINPMYFNGVLGFPYLSVGGFMFMIPAVGFLVNRLMFIFGNRLFCEKIYLLICVLSFAVMLILELYFSQQPNFYLIVAALVMFGVGWGLINSSIPIIFMKRTETDFINTKVSMVYSFFNLGAVVWLSICVGIFHGVTKEALSVALPAPETDLQHALVNGFISQPDFLQRALDQIDIIYQNSIFVFKNIFMHGMLVMLMPLLVFTAFAFVGIMLMVRKHP